MRTVRHALLLTALCCIACTDGVTALSNPNLHVASDSAVYSRANSGEATVHLALHHNGGRTVALTGCPRPPALFVEQATTSGWEEFHSSGVICLAIHSPSTIALRASSSLDFTVSAAQPGRYRVRVFVGPDAGAPELAILSNEFVVR